MVTMAEEFGEVAKEVNTFLRNLSENEPLRHGVGSRERLILELEQLAGCAAMWAQYEREHDGDRKDPADAV